MARFLGYTASITAIALVSLIVFFFTNYQDRYHWRQKITVTLDTPDGPKVGSSVVVGTLTHTKWGPPETRGATSNVIGETVYVEVQQGRYLLADLKTIPNATRVIFPDVAPIDSAMRLNDSSNTDPIQISSQQYPDFFAISDGDVSEARFVKSDDIGSVFGGGISIKSITLEITNDRISLDTVENFLVHSKGHSKVRSYGATKSGFQARHLTNRAVRSGIPPEWMPDFLVDYLALHL